MIDVVPSRGGYRVRFWLDNVTYVQQFAASLRRVAELVGMYEEGVTA